jgi:hypothetical protein
MIAMDCKRPRHEWQKKEATPLLTNVESDSRDVAAANVPNRNLTSSHLRSSTSDSKRNTPRNSIGNSESFSTSVTNENGRVASPSLPLSSRSASRAQRSHSPNSNSNPNNSSNTGTSNISAPSSNVSKGASPRAGRAGATTIDQYDVTQSLTPAFAPLYHDNARFVNIPNTT